MRVNAYRGLGASVFGCQLDGSANQYSRELLPWPLSGDCASGRARADGSPICLLICA
ncbi:hypothetical protein PSAC2689_50205 [Paraburkholderia sacchari]